LRLHNGDKRCISGFGGLVCSPAGSSSSPAGGHVEIVTAPLELPAIDDGDLGTRRSDLELFESRRLW
jgi:hypothetical protein